MLHVFKHDQYQFSLTSWWRAVIPNNSYIYSVEHRAWCHYLLGRKQWIDEQDVPKTYIAAALIL